MSLLHECGGRACVATQRSTANAHLRRRKRPHNDHACKHTHRCVLARLSVHTEATCHYGAGAEAGQGMRTQLQRSIHVSLFSLCKCISTKS